MGLCLFCCNVRFHSFIENGWQRLTQDRLLCRIKEISSFKRVAENNGYQCDVDLRFQHTAFDIYLVTVNLYYGEVNIPNYVYSFVAPISNVLSQIDPIANFAIYVLQHDDFWTAVSYFIRCKELPPNIEVCWMSKGKEEEEEERNCQTKKRGDE